MAKSKKLTSGAGWELVSSKKEEAEVVSLPAEKQCLRVAVEKRAKGKIVTVISGAVLSKDDLKAFSRELKDACGAGGSVQDDTVEIQGDHAERLRDWLTKHGWGLK